jgi:putative PIG3 family NAD(P)H quinone oxidoreductase
MTALPTQITAIEIAEYGGPEVLVPTQRPMPAPGMGEILIKVEAAGVNRPDLQQRTGGYPPPPGASDIPGLEVAGRVAAIGLGAHGWKVGDAVTALVSGGGYATYCVAPVAQCLPVPDGFSMVEAGALPETFFTVWANVFQRAGLKAGESILIHGGSSGIGTTAIQLAKAFGARVFATAGSWEKCRACETLGAERCVNYKDEDFVDVLKKPTGGVNVILDMVGGDYIQKNLSLLAIEGRLVNIAYLKGSRVEVDFLPILRKRLTVTASTLRPRTVEQKGAIAAELREQVWPLLSANRVRPQIFATFPLERAADAHRLMESLTHIGKIVLTAAS